MKPEEGAMQSRAQAIEALLTLLTDQPVVICNGWLAREVYKLADRPSHFYMVGAMGLAAAVGLGLALSKPSKTVVVFDGDGNLLMGLGTLATVGAIKPKNLIHVVFDNEVYGSSGNQPSYAQRVRLDQMAKAAGYVNIERVREREDLVYEFKDMLGKEGPSFLLMKINELAEDVGRVPLEPPAITQRFMRAIGS